MLQEIKQSVRNDVATIKSTYNGLGITASIFSAFQGRATFFAILFSTEGAIIIAFALWGFVRGHDVTPLGSILSSLALLDGAIFTGVVGHSLKEDYFERRKRLDDQIAPQPPVAS
jgi:hypothetical protein